MVIKKNYIHINDHKLLLFLKKKNLILKKNFYLENFFYLYNKTQTIINIKITPNNTIINLIQNNKIIYTLSAGKLKLKSSKKNYRTVYNLIINEFIKKLKDLKIKKHILIRILAPKTLRQKILRRFRFYIQDFNIYQIPRKYVFNGCRVKKIKRKKRKGLRLFK